jgi:putative solute:sodium symporter small subunit
MSNNEQHWAKTRGRIGITVAIWFFLGYGVFMFGESINSASFLGYPLAYYMCAQGSLIAFVVLLFWFANRQEAIDEEFGFAEKEED